MSSTTHLPSAVADYFALIDSSAPAHAIRTFSLGAAVTDDGNTYRGHDEIHRWLTGAASEFTTTSLLLSSKTTANVTTVVVRLTGNFPGGQVDLRHTFTLDTTGLIDTLTIAV